MKLKDYIETLQNLVAQDPNLAEAEMIYCEDDEGNAYKYVGFSPVVIYGSDSTSSYVDTFEADDLSPDELTECTKFVCVN